MTGAADPGRRRAVLLRHELGWLPPLEDALVRHHVAACPACILDCTLLRFAAELVGLDAVRGHLRAVADGL